MALRQDELTSLCDDVDLDRDRALVERCQAGDTAAFGNLYARYYERLLRFCLRRLNDRHEAEDAAQEAFARAWKALPRFAGERRFYPWLTVIAGNICTDMLRRRSRSTPTDDMELTAQQPLGVVGDDTSEELVLAAVDGELVNRALDRLSTRHRHVLAMREGSGWTYQQIADHEGVEIGTIETLLWRARQALKREFAVVSESNGALAGFLVASAALFRRTIFRIAHRGATMQSQTTSASGNGFGLRNAIAGVAFVGGAVAAAIIAPHALSTNESPHALTAPTGSALAAPPLVFAAPSGTPTSGADGTATGDTGSAPPAGSDGSGSGTSGLTGNAVGATSGSALNGATSLVGGLTGGLTGGSSGTSLTGGITGATGSLGTTVNGVAGGLGQTVTNLGNTVNGVTNGLGQTVQGVTGGLGSVGGTVGGVTNNLSQTLGGTVSGVTQGVNGILNGSTSSSAPSSGTNTTTTTTTPGGLVGGLTGGLTKTVGGLLGG